MRFARFLIISVGREIRYLLAFKHLDILWKNQFGTKNENVCKYISVFFNLF